MWSRRELNPHHRSESATCLSLHHATVFRSESLARTSFCTGIGRRLRTGRCSTTELRARVASHTAGFEPATTRLADDNPIRPARARLFFFGLLTTRTRDAQVRSTTELRARFLDAAGFEPTTV